MGLGGEFNPSSWHLIKSPRMLLCGTPGWGILVGCRQEHCSVRRGGYSLGGPAEVEFWGRSPEVSIAWIGACRNGASTISGRAGGRAAAAAGHHLALDPALRRPPVLVEHWEAGASLSRMGEGSGHPRPNPVEFPFLSSVNFCAINIFPFPFWIQNLVQVGGS